MWPQGPDWGGLCNKPAILQPCIRCRDVGPAPARLGLLPISIMDCIVQKDSVQHGDFAWPVPVNSTPTWCSIAPWKSSGPKATRRPRLTICARPPGSAAQAFTQRSEASGTCYCNRWTTMSNGGHPRLPRSWRNRCPCATRSPRWPGSSSIRSFPERAGAAVFSATARVSCRAAIAAHWRAFGTAWRARRRRFARRSCGRRPRGNCRRTPTSMRSRASSRLDFRGCAWSAR